MFLQNDAIHPTIQNHFLKLAKNLPQHSDLEAAHEEATNRIHLTPEDKYRGSGETLIPEYGYRSPIGRYNGIVKWTVDRVGANNEVRVRSLAGQLDDGTRFRYQQDSRKRRSGFSSKAWGVHASLPFIPSGQYVIKHSKLDSEEEPRITALDIRGSNDTHETFGFYERESGFETPYLDEKYGLSFPASEAQSEAQKLVLAEVPKVKGFFATIQQAAASTIEDKLEPGERRYIGLQHEELGEMSGWVKTSPDDANEIQSFNLAAATKSGQEEWFDYSSLKNGETEVFEYYGPDTSEVLMVDKDPTNGNEKIDYRATRTFDDPYNTIFIF